MKRTVRANVVMTCLVIVLVGCTRRNVLMSATGLDATSARPEPGRALIVFLRPGRAAGLVHAALYDDDKIIGVSSAHTAIAYQAVPGQHRFMVVGEAADFMGADLVAGRVYYARVDYRTGAWRVRFSLYPLNAQNQSAAIAEWQREVRFVAMNDLAVQWDRENRPSVLEKRDTYLRKWLAKSEDSRPLLRPDDGVEAPGYVAAPGMPNAGPVAVGDDRGEAGKSSSGGPSTERSAVERLRELGRLRDAGLITEREYQEKRRDVLRDL